MAGRQRGLPAAWANPASRTHVLPWRAGGPRTAGAPRPSEGCPRPRLSPPAQQGLHFSLVFIPMFMFFLVLKVM